MKSYELKGVVRQELGKKATKAVRTSSSIPCVLYGLNENVHFTVEKSDVHKLIYTPEVYVVDLTVDGKKTTAIMQALQFHPVSDNVLHIDFLEVNKTKPVIMEIPVRLHGLAAGVKAGGKLSLQTRKLKVKGIYTDFPEVINVDVTKLVLGKTIQVGDLKLDKLQILNAKNAVVAQVKLTRAARSGASTEEESTEEEETETAEE